MPRKAKPKPDDADQSKRFEEAANELGADKSGRSFVRALKAVVPKKHSDKGRAGRMDRG